MKRIVWVALGWFLLSMANTFAAEKELVTVAISPAVQEQIRKANPDERKNMEAAIKTGNKFIPQHLDGTAYVYGEGGNEREYKKWLGRTRPLIAKEARDWYSDWNVYSDSSPTLEINGQKAIQVVLCPHAELVSISAANMNFDTGWEDWEPVSLTDSVVLKYRVKLVGMWVYYEAHIKDFLQDQKDEFEEVLISLNWDNKVNQVIPQYGASAWISDVILRQLQRDIDHPEVLMGETLEEVKARNEKYKQVIKIAKSSVVAKCGSN